MPKPPKFDKVYSHCCQPTPLFAGEPHCCDCGVLLTGEHRHLKACIHNWPNVPPPEWNVHQWERATYNGRLASTSVPRPER